MSFARKGRLFESRPFPVPLRNKRDMVSRVTQETLIMFKKLISGIIGGALMMAVGMTAMNAHALPGCYKTGKNTVQCTR